MQADVNKVGRYFFPHRPVGRVGHADGHTVAFEAFGDFIVEPRFVTKLDDVPRAFPSAQNFQEFAQPFDVLFQKRGKLPKYSGEAFAQRRGRFATTNHGFFHADQLLVVCDVPVTFDGKCKIVRRLVAPFFERAFLRQLVERAVHLDACKTFRAESKPLFLRRIPVETVAPAFVIPTTRADMCFAGHGLNCFSVYFSALS